MSFGGFFALMALATSAAWGSWIFVLLQIDPLEAGFTGFALFYLTLWISLMGTITLFGALYRIWIRKREFLLREVRTSFRHGVLLSALAVGFLLLSSRNWLQWWSVLPIVLVLGIIEYVFLLIYDR